MFIQQIAKLSLFILLCTSDKSARGQAMEPNRPAQTKTTLRGSVVDNAGMRIPNTRVDVRAVSRTASTSVNENRPAPLLLETSREGEFSAELPPGFYEVCAYRFRESCRSIQLNEEQKTSADIRYDDSDDAIAHGVAGDSTGRVYFVDFASMSVDFSRLRPGATMPDGLHTEVTPCLQPARMKRTRKGQLMCLIEDRWITR